jgi:hypothetical protein
MQVRATIRAKAQPVLRPDLKAMETAAFYDWCFRQKNA